jgi:hypothetical protein
MWEFKRSGLFNPSPLELEEPTNKWGGGGGFMVFTVEPCPVPSLN